MVQLGEMLARHLATIGDLPAEDHAALCALPGEIRPAPRHADVLKLGERPKEVVLVLSGLLFRYALSPDGIRQLHSFYLPTEAPCLETLYIDYMDNGLAAAVDCEIGVIPHEPVYRLIDERPHVRKLIWRQTLVQAAIFRQWLLRNSRLPAHACVANLFCEIFTRARAAGLVRGDTCDLPMTQELLADAVGMTAVHANRTVMLLRETGAVEWKGGKLTIRDWDRLAEIGDFDPAYLHLRPGPDPAQALRR